MTKEMSEQQKIVLWFIQLRWWALLIMLLVVLTSIFLGNLHFQIIPCLVIIAAASLYNILYPSFVKHFRGFSEDLSFTYLRSTADLLTVAVMVHFTGGIESPFTLMLPVELAAISIFGFGWLPYFLAGQAAFLYVLVCLMETYSFIPHYRLINLPGTLYLSPNYAISKGLSLFLTLWLLVFLVSYLADRLREKQLEIERLSNAKIDFMNLVMHETKSPLTSIIGYVDILIKGTLGQATEVQLNPLKVIQRQSYRMLDMINDLLDIARLESGIAKIEKQPTDLLEVIAKVVDEMKPQIDEHKIELIQEPARNLPQIKLDDGKIAEVMTNFLSNAIKFSKPGGKLFISSQIMDSVVEVSVRDEGLGIDQQDLPHIFEKFHRANSTEAAQVRGTGLGLALSKLIVEAHGGRIWATSGGRGQGAVLHFTLPL
jgi:signal transduction histidine kinase